VGNLSLGPTTVRAIARAFPGVKGVILSTVQPHGLALRHGAAVVPRLADAARAIRRTIDACRRLGQRYHLSACENPLCFVLTATGERAGAAAVRGYVRRRLHANGCQACRLLVEMDKDKIKPPACARCALDGVCGGVWRAQVAIHGTREVRPVVERGAA